MARSLQSKPIPVPEWLILGSFPLSDRAPGRWTQSGYPCEAHFAPQAGDTFNGATWVRHASPSGRIEFHDPALPFGHRSWCHAYACTYVYSPARQRVRLVLAADNSAVVWLNGQEVHRVECNDRGVLLDRDLIDVTLARGWNVLLIKAAQSQHMWGLMVHFQAVRKTPLVLRFAVKRPAGPRFVGLRRRRAGLAARFSPRVVRPFLAGAKPVGQIQLRLFNDANRSASRIRVTILDAAGRTLVRGTRPALAAFTEGDVTLTVGAEEWAHALRQAGEKPLTAKVQSSLGTTAAMLPPDTAARFFCSMLTDLLVELRAKGETKFTVPRSFAGHPARVELCAAHADDLPREYAWPVLPAADFGAEQTARRKLTINLNPPPGMADTYARIVFGEPAVHESASRARRMMNDLGLDLSGGGDLAGQGLRCFLQGDVPGAWRLLDELLERVGAEQPDRRGESVTLVGHAHIDMNWLWTGNETLQCSHDTFRQVLAFFDEFPDFHFSQSQPAIYEMIERFDPDMFENIRRQVAAGRWELLGGFLTEGDTNLASGEGLARAVLLGQRYFRSRFGKIARVGWLPDNFGHAAQLPQILRLAGMEFFYAHRCQPRPGAYVWEGVDGSRVITYATSTYNGEINTAIRELPARIAPKHGRALWAYGVGDHGGGPTRRDLHVAHALNETPGSPTLRCGTAESFFHALEPDAADYDVTRGELQAVFEGCYTSIARIKEANRRGENLLFAGEMVAALAALYGEPYPHHDAGRIWHDLAFNQFHDILCGSATHDSNRESIARYDRAVEKARRLRFEALRRLSQHVDTQSCGQPLVVFNPLPRPRDDVVEAEIYSHECPPTVNVRQWWNHERRPVQPVDVGQGPYPTLHVVDSSGAPIAAQITDVKLFPNGHRLKVEFPAEAIPACGYRVYHAFPAEVGGGRDKALTLRGTSIDTPFFKVQLDAKTGHLTRVYDKRRKADVLRRGQPANVLKIYMEKPHTMSAWELGPVSAVHELNAARSVEVVERGPVRVVIEVRREWNRSTFTQRVVVYRHRPRIDFELDANWFELGGPDRDAAMLRVAFPLNVRQGRFVCDTPFAAVERPTDGREVPAQKWIDLSGPRGGAALLNDGKYGHRCTDHVLETTLLRASYEPDPFPDLGPHHIRYALWPHAGAWDTAGVAEAGLAFNAPCATLEAPPHPGPLPCEQSFVRVEPHNVSLSAVKRPEEGPGLIVRVYDTHGKATQATIELSRPVHYAALVNLLEDLLIEDADPVQFDGHRVTVPLRAHQIASVRIEL